MKILVTTPNGRIGSEIARQLRERKVPHRLAAHTVENARRDFPGSEVARLDYGDPATFAPALEGVDTVYLAQPGLLPEGPEQRLIDAARAAGVRRVVKLSGMGAENGDSAHRRVEKHLEASGLGWTHLRPTWFMQNFSSMQADGIRNGVLAEPTADAKTAFIDARDIADVAVKVLTEDGHEGRAYTLTGPEALDRAQVADTLSQVIGRAVRYVPLTDEQFRQALAAFAPPPHVERLGALYAEVRSGVTGVVHDTVPRMLGRPARAFRQFASDYKAAWA